MKTTSEDYVSVFRLRQGDQTREVYDSFGSLNDAVGGMKPLDWEDMEKVRAKFQKKP